MTSCAEASALWIPKLWVQSSFINPIPSPITPVSSSTLQFQCFLSHSSSILFIFEVPVSPMFADGHGIFLYLQQTWKLLLICILLL